MRILVFQHLALEHPGALLPLWRRAGITWDTVELDAGAPIPALAAYDVLVVMGGPMDVWQEAAHPWLAAEKQVIRDWVLGLGRPFLGICLGHQLLAEAAGGAVGPAAAPEVGLVPVRLTPAGRTDPLFAGFGEEIETFQWHGAEVTRLPPGAETLAGNAACAVQAFRVGRHAYGLQFHVELTDTMVRDWRAIPEYAAALAAALGPAAAGLEAAVATRLPAFAATVERLNANFLSHISLRHGAA